MGRHLFLIKKYRSNDEMHDKRVKATKFGSRHIRNFYNKCKPNGMLLI